MTSESELSTHQLDILHGFVDGHPESESDLVPGLVDQISALLRNQLTNELDLDLNDSATQYALMAGMSFHSEWVGEIMEREGFSHCEASKIMLTSLASIIKDRQT